MAHSKRIRVPPVSRLWDRLMLDGRRTAVAFGLIAIMVVMWSRVLLGHKPDSAAAGAPAGPMATQPQPSLEVRFLDLPRLAGRHDFLERDFFTVQDRARFRQNAGARDPSADPEVHVVSPDHAQEVIRRVAQELKVEAVLWSENPQAFINDQLRRIGEKITLKEGTDSFEFEVLRIYEDSVLVECHGTHLTLKLAQNLDVRK